MVSTVSTAGVVGTSVQSGYCSFNATINTPVKTVRYIVQRSSRDGR